MARATKLEHLILQLINETRAENGLRPLTMELSLNDAADDHSQWMINNDTFSHSGAGGSKSYDRIGAAGTDLAGNHGTAENIAAHPYYKSEDDRMKAQAQAIHDAFMDSPGHRANILDPDHTHIGIGVKYGTMTYSGGASARSVVVTQNFAYSQGTFDEDHRGTDSRDNLVSGDGNDVLQGLGGKDKLNGKSGNDTLIGGDGDDSLRGGAGDDRVEGGNGDDLVRSRAGDNKLLGNNGDDTIISGNGSDAMNGGAGKDLLKGNRGDDTLNGGGGNDNLSASRGNDKLNGGGGNDTLKGGNDDDSLNGGGGDDNAKGGKGNDKINGGSGKDILTGNSGNDKIDGGKNADKLNGGKGDDTLTGGDGEDVFIFDGGADVITDYDPDQDQIELDASLHVKATGQDIGDLITMTSTGAEIDFGDGNILVIEGNFTLAELEADLSFV